MPAKDDGTVDWQSGIRTGPYMLEKFEPGVTRNLQAQSQLLSSDKAWFDEVERPRSSPTSTARTNALTSGEVALHRPLRPEDARAC